MQCNYKVSYKLPVMVFLCAILFLGLILWLNKNLIYNETNSEPIGWYWINLLKREKVNEIKVEKLYVIKPSNDVHLQVLKRLGFKINSRTLLKHVVAVGGDMVEVVESGILVNNKLIKNSIAKKTARGVDLQPLPVGYKHRLIEGEYFVMGETDYSFDSRYFGILSRDNFIAQASLIIRE